MKDQVVKSDQSAPKKRERKELEKENYLFGRNDGQQVRATMAGFIALNASSLPGQVE